MKTKWKNPEIVVLSKELGESANEPVKELTAQEIVSGTLDKVRAELERSFKELERMRIELENAQVQYDAMYAVMKELEKQHKHILK